MRQTAPLLALLLTAAMASGAPINYGAAIESQRARVAAEPQSAGAQNDLANLLVMVGEYEEAEQVYRRAIELDPTRASTLFNLGLLLQERGDNAAAMRQFRKTIDLEPGHAWAHYQIGVIYAHWHLDPLAVRAYARAFVLDPRLGNPRFNPHLIANPLATESMLRAYREDPPAAQAPAVFDDAQGVARMLIFEATPHAESAPEKPPAAAPTVSAKPAPAASARPAGPRTTPVPAAAVVAKPEPPVDEAEEGADSGYLEVKVDDPESVPTGGVPTLGVYAPGGAETPAAPGDRPVPSTPVPGSVTRPTPTPAPPIAPGTSRPGPGFVPGPGSTGRMTVDVVPLGG